MAPGTRARIGILITLLAGCGYVPVSAREIDAPTGSSQDAAVPADLARPDASASGTGEGRVAVFDGPVGAADAAVAAVDGAPRPPADLPPAVDGPAPDASCGAVDDPANCGRCGRSCAGLPHVRPGVAVACQEGRCLLPPGACEPGWGNCLTTSDQDGCETSLSTAAQCGSCSTSCGTGSVCLVSGGIPQCVNPASGLHQQRWNAPCGAMDSNPQLCRTLPAGAMTCPEGGHLSVDRPITMGGQPGVVYQVKIRFRGVVEPRAYVGGTAVGDRFRIGGMPQPGSGFNAYALSVSAPARVYYLNDSGGPMERVVFAIDHEKTIAIEGGATVRLQLEEPDCLEVRNCDALPPAPCRPVVVPGVPPAPAAFDGQFIQMDVVEVAARP
jgi:hypothetical protein